MNRIMVVDDEPGVLHALRRVLRMVPCVDGSRRYQLEVDTFDSPTMAFKKATCTAYDLFIVDYKMPLMNGVEFLSAVRELQPDSQRMILSGYADLNALIGAINEANIFRFIGKPWRDFDVVAAIAQALSHRQLLLENRRLADLARLNAGQLSPEELELKRLESLEPGLTKVNWGPDGSVILDDENLDL